VPLRRNTRVFPGGAKVGGSAARFGAPSRHSLTLVLVLGPLALTVLGPNLAHAGNGNHPRTPVDWSDAPCMTVIDRSQNPIYPLTYAVPFEDTQLTDDEVADSRRHQFLGFCRDHDRDAVLPNWISEADLDAAAAEQLGDPDEVDLDLEVLDYNVDWTDCWTRINADDQRRPITFASAEQPLLWDTSALAAGTWVVEAYTWEPWFNLWTQHPGVFKIVDDPDPAASPPAAALTYAEQSVDVGDNASISGCVDAMPGTTMTLSWASASATPTWEVFAEDLPADQGSFDLPYAPTLAAAANAVSIRLELSDPMGRSWTAYSPVYIQVTEDFGETGCEEGGFVGGDDCDEEDTEDGSDTNDGDGGSSDEGAAAKLEPKGCGCSLEANHDLRPGHPGHPGHPAHPAHRGAAWAVVLAALGRRARRRRSSARGEDGQDHECDTDDERCT